MIKTNRPWATSVKQQSLLVTTAHYNLAKAISQSVWRPSTLEFVLKKKKSLITVNVVVS